jgi:hypothetical protein
MVVRAIVLRSSGAAKGEFSRIGYFNLFKDRVLYGTAWREQKKE